MAAARLEHDPDHHWQAHAGGGSDYQFYTEAGGAGNHAGFAIQVLQHMALPANPYIGEHELESINVAACEIEDRIHDEESTGIADGTTDPMTDSQESGIDSDMDSEIEFDDY